jgi:hypothetical protein
MESLCQKPKPIYGPALFILFALGRANASRKIPSSEQNIIYKTATTTCSQKVIGISPIKRKKT